MIKCKLGDIYKFQYGKGNNIPESKGEYPCYGSNGQVGYHVEYNSEDAPIIGHIGAYAGVVIWAPDKHYVTYNGVICTLKDRKMINPRYGFYLLKSQDFVNKIRRGVAQPFVSYDLLEEPVVNIPSRIEQDKIVGILDMLAIIIENKKEQIKNLNELIKSQFVEMFGSVNDNKKCYEIKTLNEVFEFIKDGTHSTPTYTDDKINGVKFLSAKDVTTGIINWSNIKYIPLELHNELVKRVKPQKNDILLAKNGTTGICAKVDRDEIFDIYVSLALLRPKKEYLVDYLVQAINNDMTKEQFDRSLKGVGVPNLHLGEIQKVKIIVPPIELQNRFAEFVKQIDKQKFEIQKSLEETQKLQESLMNKYFG